MKTVVFYWPVNYGSLHPAVFNSILEYRGLNDLIRRSDGRGFSVEFTDDVSPELVKTVEEDFQNVIEYFGEKNYGNIIQRLKKVPSLDEPHPAVKADTKVNGGALQLALNVLRRAGKNEVADELEKTAERIEENTTKDKELLEKAAKAYGIPHVYCETRGDMSHHDYATGWNPLWDQDDCDKMEAKLRLSVQWYDNSVVVYQEDVRGYQEFFSNHKDKDFARRYAAVKMAADLA